MKLTKENILSATDRGLRIFEHFLRNTSFRGINKGFHNPFYEDTKPSCRVYFNKDTQQYNFKDFGDSAFHMDSFALVAHLHQLSTKGADFSTILEIINQQLGLNLESISSIHTPYLTPAIPVQKTVVEPEPEQEKDVSFIPPTYRNFNMEERDYWSNYGIDLAVLNHYQVKAVERFESTSQAGKTYSLSSTDDEPMFAYSGKDFVKYYRPFSKKLRFLYQGKKTGTYCFGLAQLPKKGDILFITGGEKDVMSLAAKGFHAIAFNSETANIPKSIIKRLRFRFKHLVLLFDNDPTGLKSMQNQADNLKSYGAKKLILPAFPDNSGKDISDFFAQGHSREDLLQLFIELLEREYEETMAMIASCEVQFDRPPDTPDPILQINDTVIGSVGNLLALTGPEGSGKSNFLGAVLAGSIGNDQEEIDTLGADVLQNRSGKSVLVYDTEQSEDQLYRNVHQVMRRAKRGKPPEWLKVYGLVSIDRKDRMLSILQSMDQFYYKYGGIQLVIIDGIADLIDSVNDEEKAVALIDELFRLAGIYNTCILCVLHLSPSGYKLRGHLGSEIQRKAAGIIAVEKEEGKDISIIKALKVRDGSPLEVPQIQMIWNHEHKYHVYGGENVPTTPLNRKQEELKQIAIAIFQEKSERTYGELVTELCSRLGVKERMGRNYLGTLKKLGVVYKNTEKDEYKIVR